MVYLGTPITLSLRKSHEEVRTARSAPRITLRVICTSLLFLFFLFPSLLWMSEASMKIFHLESTL